MDWVEKHIGELITWFCSLSVVASGMYWRLQHSERDIKFLKEEIKELKEASARKYDVDSKLEKLEDHLIKQIQRVELDIKSQNDLTRDFVEKVYNKFDAIQKEMNAGFTALNKSIYDALSKGK